MNQEQNAAQNGAPPNMTDDEVLYYTRGVRVKMVTSLMTPASPGAPIGPQETGDRIFLTNMLNGLDSQAINLKKVAAEQKNADNTAAVVAELLRGINKNTAFTPLGNQSDIIDVSMRVVPPSILDMPSLPGEMDVTPPQLDYATFVRSQGKDIDQIGKNAVHPEAVVEDDMT